MAESYLFDEGWRQGSLIRATLSAHTLDLPDEKETSFDLWVLTTQDCDLTWTKCTDFTRDFELRPVYKQSKGDKFDGIRNRTMRLYEGMVIKADSPRLTMTARKLTAMKEKRENILDDVARREFKTWLGYRYDRPAVPVPFDKVGLEILYPLIIEQMPQKLTGAVRDVLVYYESTSEIRLVAILRNEQDEAVAYDWLDDVGEKLFEQHQITIRERKAGTSRKISLETIETYYGLDSANLGLTAPAPDVA